MAEEKQDMPAIVPAAVHPILNQAQQQSTFIVHSYKKINTLKGLTVEMLERSAMPFRIDPKLKKP